MDNKKSSDKKMNFEDLGKEELVNKCKTLFCIIQKAKQSKSILQEEIEHLKVKLQDEINKNKANLANEESIERLTEQNSKLVLDIEDLKLKNDSLITNLNRYKEEKKLAEVKLFNLDNENVTLKKQLKQLSDDNEQLISHLESLEKQIQQLNEIGLEQQKQLLKLEENNALTSPIEENDYNTWKMKSEAADCEDEADSQNCELYKLNKKFKDKLNIYHSKLIKLAINIKELKNDKELILKQFKIYVDQVGDWKDQLFIASNNFLKLLGQLQNENQDLRLENSSLKNLNEQFMKQIEVHKTDDQKSKDLEDIQVVTGDSKQQNMNIVGELEKSLPTEKQLAETSVEEIKILTKDNNFRNVEVKDDEQEELSSCRQFVTVDIQTENKFIAEQEFNEQILLLKTENSQLLTDMNEINHELKERGENLSKLEAHCTELKKKLKMYESQDHINVNDMSEKEETIKKLNSNILEKEKTITDLKNEIELLREKVTGNFENVNSVEMDNMSTSTISKVEEMDKLKDLDGCWEEKYGKLKSLAIKLKAKLNEQIKEVNDEKFVKKELHQKLNNTLEKLKILQQQYDCINDELIEKNKRCQDYSKQNTAIEEKDNMISKLRSEIDTMKEEKLATEMWKKEISAKVQTLRKELESNELEKYDFEKKLKALKSDLEVKELALKNEIENHKKTRNSLKHFTNENKKNTVLNLEMQDYEKSIKDLSLKLEKQNEQIAKMKEQIDCQKLTNSILVNQKNDLQEKIEFYESSLNSAVNEKSACLKKLSEADNILKHKTENIADLHQQLENLRLQNEELYSSLSSDIIERQKIIKSLREEKEKLHGQNFTIQQNNKELQEILISKEEEISVLNKKFENYKIRAQSVLRQNQNRDIGLEEKLSENVSSLLSQIQVLNTEINDLRVSNESLKALNETLQLEHTSLITNGEKLSENLRDVKDRFEKLQLKYDQAVNEHIDTVKSLKVHAETLSLCYRQQLSEQEVRHNREIIDLHSRIEKSQASPELPLPPLPSTTREDGEGSESTESVKNLPVSLEKLLSEEDEQKINILKKQIREQESKLHHLTELLADTEQDLAKHIQMNKVLKEEIRRQQRAVEREKHAENMEYLKNVVLKFISLHNGDERSRLVPVLNTILKLSPEETRTLDMVAKGDAGMKAWSSYLPVWSSSNKS